MEVWHRCQLHDIDELRQRLLHVWRGLKQSLFMTQLTMVNTLACLFVGLPLVDILNIPCDCQFVSLYLMNFMFHITLHAVGNILRVHYKSMKCDVSFSQGSEGSVSTLFRSGEHVFHVCEKNCSSCLQQCKDYKYQTSFSRVMITNVLPPFYESQCTCGADWSMTRSAVWKQYWPVMDRRPDRQTSRAIAHTAQRSFAR